MWKQLPPDLKTSYVNTINDPDKPNTEYGKPDYSTKNKQQPKVPETSELVEKIKESE